MRTETEVMSVSPLAVTLVVFVLVQPDAGEQKVSAGPNAAGYYSNMEVGISALRNGGR